MMQVIKAEASCTMLITLCGITSWAQHDTGKAKTAKDMSWVKCFNCKQFGRYFKKCPKAAY